MKNPLQKYQHIDHTADLGIKVFGLTLAELFENAAFGLFDNIAYLEKVNPNSELRVEVQATDREALLVTWLSELNYLFLTRKELFASFHITEIDDESLTATIKGEKLDLDRHEIYTEVKAVTYHKLYVKESDRGWEAQVIFDL